MIKNHELSNAMKRLKMPGALDNIELRVKEAKENNFGYLEFLSLLLQDEIINRDSNILSKKLKTGGLVSRMTIESFDTRFNAAALAPKTVRDLASCHFVEQFSADLQALGKRISRRLLVMKCAAGAVTRFLSKPTNCLRISLIRFIPEGLSDYGRVSERLIF